MSHDLYNENRKGGGQERKIVGGRKAGFPKIFPNNATKKS